MGLQEIQNERFENSEYWPKQDSEVLKFAFYTRLGSHRASPRGSHWRQASSTGPAAPVPRATTH